MKCNTCSQTLGDNVMLCPECRSYRIAHPWRTSTPPVAPGYVYRKLADGTFLVGFKGDLDNNHWHLASDGTVLSVKEGGNHLFRRTDVTRQIKDVCPELNISFLWKG